VRIGLATSVRAADKCGQKKRLKAKRLFNRGLDGLKSFERYLQTPSAVALPPGTEMSV
jgi:hypothetical protein